MANVPPGYSNYYRPGGATGPGGAPIRPPGVYFDTIGDAWNLVKQDMGLWVACVLLLLVITSAIQVPLSALANVIAYGDPIAAEPDAPFTGRFWLHQGLSMALGIIAQTIYFTMQAGLIHMGVKRLDGLPVGVEDVFAGFKNFGAMVVAGFLTHLVVTVGILLCLLPGFFFLGAFAFAGIRVLRGGGTGLEGMTDSWNALKPVAFSMFLLILVLSLLQIVGFVLCCVGLLFTLPIYYATLAIHYRYFFPPAEGGPTYEIGPEAPSST